MHAKVHGTRSIVLAWAVAASLIVHAAILVATLPGAGRGAPAVGPPLELRATLEVVAASEPVPEPQAPVAPVLAALPEKSPIALPMPAAAPRAVAPPSPPVSTAGMGTMEVIAEPLADRTRIGEYMTRQMSEFPIEIDRPPRLDEKIVARYPATAAAQGREDSVVIWAIVDASGTVEEAYVAEGTDEFAAEALAAVRAGRFIPAQNKLRAQPYPIALQFDFRAGSASTALAK